ncbi:MAG TPA: 3-hydroxyacyl-ACP dehydratase FabZ [Accumulibacter sp.]|uniref:3-hydroxyacyl-ACP dehydratase FabZ n=1 Tax=Accumulibacter sp. TaxID=2053492 RepID=UPI000EB8FCE3|nr:3-hydroxyacyl-ACP dehydratase FabZ [Accumulibacter sp.]HCZ16414.1 3-hydroxyacyl-[acyl-carrier-protein] dehydratase FabZ [Accumulibacter sp.]HRF72915.1 3-hydroxyacyl-ACP dehydratase FabZ [Accumulibacter sp.]
MDIHEILEHLPHRYPFLLVDRVVDFELGKAIHAYKNVTVNEPFFVGHFPHHPVMPGVLIMEALAQAAGILSFKTMGVKPDATSVFYFVGIDGARFKKPVTAGDQLHLHVQIVRQLRGIWKYKAEARVDGEIVAEAELMCAKRDVAGTSG